MALKSEEDWNCLAKKTNDFLIAFRPRADRLMFQLIRTGALILMELALPMAPTAATRQRGAPVPP
jgi:hypothetical protein